MRSHSFIESGLVTHDTDGDEAVFKRYEPGPAGLVYAEISALILLSRASR